MADSKDLIRVRADREGGWRKSISETKSTGIAGIARRRA
ncbi:hypothetical protein BN129_1409 [Cronobacter sakazakii 701]|nr:hypothetical protein BN129_1409 [Cronobacter sakazakii 701]